MKKSMIALVACGAVACAGAPAPVATPPSPAPAPVVVPVAPPVAQPTPPAVPANAFNPEGSYALQTVFGGQSASLAVELWRENGQWHGTAGIQNLGSADLSAFAQDGRKLRLTVVSAAGPSFVLNLEVKPDDTVTGDWSGNNDGSRITGKKVR